MNQHEPIQLILFFDGVCHLCNGLVDFLIKRISSGQRAKVLKFAPLQGETAKKILSPEAIGELNTVVFYQNGHVFRKSQAILRCMSLLKFPYNLITVFRFIPRQISDLVYNLIAKNRYKWFGKSEVCRLPTAQERQHFLP